VNDAEPSLGARLAAVRASVEDAAATAGRPVDDITTIVVTKFHPASLIRELHELGVTDFGESRHQEARQKAAELAGLEATWHFVGQLQGKKARQVAAYADIIHSVDRESLVAALGASGGSAGGPAVGCFLQVNLTEDPDRGGAPPGRLLPLAELALGAGGLRLLGVMAIAPLGEEPRRAFARLREASERLRTVAPDAAAISAGMSGDFREAILEGATHLRIGTAITGIRPSAG
jgi:pyridoxal phosphate enzyme (YggS family)